jgi:hypothetical protein
MNMHEELVFFPGSSGDVEERNFVSTSVFIFDTELVPFK